VEPFLIVYLHLQWNAVLTQIMLCLAEAVEAQAPLKSIEKK
jgi:hypothetical protein